MEISEKVLVLDSKAKHTEYATCQTKLSLEEIKKIVSVYEAILPADSFSVRIEFRPNQMDFIFTVFFDEEIANKARKTDIDIWFICRPGKVESFLSKK